MCKCWYYHNLAGKGINVQYSFYCFDQSKTSIHIGNVNKVKCWPFTSALSRTISREFEEFVASPEQLCPRKHLKTLFIVSEKMPRIDNDIKLDFKDVLVRPKRSTLKSRSEVQLVKRVTGTYFRQSCFVFGVCHFCSDVFSFWLNFDLFRIFIIHAFTVLKLNYSLILSM